MTKKYYTDRERMEIVKTAIINGLDPYRHLEYALENIGKKPIEAILPYSKDLEIR